jgi:hypothetical protein
MFRTSSGALLMLFGKTQKESMEINGLCHPDTSAANV